MSFTDTLNQVALRNAENDEIIRSIGQGVAAIADDPQDPMRLEQPVMSAGDAVLIEANQATRRAQREARALASTQAFAAARTAPPVDVATMVAAAGAQMSAQHRSLLQQMVQASQPELGRAQARPQNSTAAERALDLQRQGLEADQAGLLGGRRPVDEAFERALMAPYELNVSTTTGTTTDVLPGGSMPYTTGTGGYTYPVQPLTGSSMPWDQTMPGVPTYPYENGYQPYTPRPNPFGNPLPFNPGGEICPAPLSVPLEANPRLTPEQLQQLADEMERRLHPAGPVLPAAPAAAPQDTKPGQRRIRLPDEEV